MLVQIESVIKQTTSCNFCNKVQLKESSLGLKYPYENVVTFKREGNGLCASICEDCLNELTDKGKKEFSKINPKNNE